MTGDLVDRLRAKIAEAEGLAKQATQTLWDGPANIWYTATRRDDDFIAANSPALVLRTIQAHRKILDEHAPVLRIVEWSHDQTGKGEAMVCPRCQNADHTTNWHPPIGGAGVLPEGFVAPYILAPCNTLVALAAVYFPEETTDG